MQLSTSCPTRGTLVAKCPYAYVYERHIRYGSPTGTDRDRPPLGQSRRIVARRHDNAAEYNNRDVRDQPIGFSGREMQHTLASAEPLDLQAQ